MMSEIVLCPKCNGNGKFYSPAQTTLEPANHCNVCDGKGAVRPLDFATLGNQEQRISDLEQREKVFERDVKLLSQDLHGEIGIESGIIANRTVLDACNQLIDEGELAAETLRKFGGE